MAAESARFRSVLADAPPEAHVPTCPDWNASDLLWHLAEVQHFWGTIVAGRLDRPPGSTPERPADRDELLEFFDSSNGLLVSSLTGTPDETPVWTWASSARNVGFVRRRQAHEAVIHRLDAELTVGLVTDLDADLATDGIAEALEHMFGGAPPWATRTGTGRIGAVSASDTGARWLVQLGRWSGTSPNTGTSYADEGMIDVVDAGEPTFEVSGRAGDLDAWFWSRPPGGPIDRHGDVAELEAIIAAGVQ
ncbi:maleylpyruvate isomerase family mycothiol-dependent enzyme [Ilumatobacter sp.]|uniref:maleylpyruvate isomerase family mycothiol-dependent enzyme n=1 Tax=Ilumatobacter sp. TaxID=1967498 RepID=UPI003AF94D53